MNIEFLFIKYIIFIIINIVLLAIDVTFVGLGVFIFYKRFSLRNPKIKAIEKADSFDDLYRVLFNYHPSFNEKNLIRFLNCLIVLYVCLFIFVFPYLIFQTVHFSIKNSPATATLVGGMFSAASFIIPAIFVIIQIHNNGRISLRSESKWRELLFELLKKGEYTYSDIPYLQSFYNPQGDSNVDKILNDKLKSIIGGDWCTKFDDFLGVLYPKEEYKWCYKKTNNIYFSQKQNAEIILLIRMILKNDWIQNNKMI